MSLVKCEGCKAEISKEAEACPKCGHPVPKGRSVFTWVLLGLVGYAIYQCTSIDEARQSAQNRRTQAKAATEATMTPEQRIAAAEAEAASKARAAEVKQAGEREFQRAVVFAKTIRGNLNNPASFELTEAIRTGAGALCFQYRGTNSFNAVILNYAVVTKAGQAASGSPTVVAKLWNKHCANQSGDNLKHIRHAL